MSPIAVKRSALNTCIAHKLKCFCREEEVEVIEEEDEEEDEPWEYDSEALKQWEQFVKKSKAIQVGSCLVNMQSHHVSQLIVSEPVCSACSCCMQK